jgi:membrane protein
VRPGIAARRGERFVRLQAISGRSVEYRPLTAAALIPQGRTILAQAARLRRRVSRHHLPILAAGLSFYGLMAMFPALVVFLSLYGLVGDPRAIEHHLAAAEGFLPDEAIRLLAREMHKLIAHPAHHLSVSLALGLGFTLAGASTAAGALMNALNIVFGLDETRGLLRRQAIALGLTAGLATFAAALLGFLALAPTMLRQLGLDGSATSLLALARWPIAALLVGGALAAIYRHGPNHGGGAGWMVGRGTPCATAAWLAATASFSLYVARFHAFDKTYGSIGAVVVLLVWLYLTALVVLVGAEIHVMARPADRAA